MPHLRIGKHLVDGIDRPTRHAGGVEPFDPLGAAAAGEMALDLVIERVAIFRSRAGGRVFGLSRHFSSADGLAKPVPHLAAGSSDVDQAVGGLKHAGRHRGRMIVAGLLRHLALDQIARGLKVEHENLRLQQRRRHRLPLAGFIAIQQSDHNAERSKQSGGQIGDRNTDAIRPVPRRASDRHQPAHALRDLIEARAAGIGAILAKAGNAGVNQPRIDARQRLVIDAEALFHVRAKILDHHVGFLDQPLERREPLRRLQVDGDAPLVAVQIHEVRVVARPAHRLFGIRRRFDLNDVGAPVGKLAHTGRPGAHARQIEHGKARQRLRCAWARHRECSCS